MIPYDTKQVVLATYTNYRGESAVRRFVPQRIWFGMCDWHPEPQWILDAYDLDKDGERSFALCDFADWKTAPQPQPVG